MKISTWALENDNKIIVIITKTAEQFQMLWHQIFRSINNKEILSYSGNSMTLMNDTKIMILSEYNIDYKLRGLSIDVLLFHNVGFGTRTLTRQRRLEPHLHRNIIIGELKYE